MDVPSARATLAPPSARPRASFRRETSTWTSTRRWSPPSRAKKARTASRSTRCSRRSSPRPCSPWPARCSSSTRRGPRTRGRRRPRSSPRSRPRSCTWPWRVVTPLATRRGRRPCSPSGLRSGRRARRCGSTRPRCSGLSLAVLFWVLADDGEVAWAGRAGLPLGAGPGRPAGGRRPRGGAGPLVRRSLAPAGSTDAALVDPAAPLRPGLPVALLRLALPPRLFGDARPLLGAVGPGAARPPALAGQGPARLHSGGPRRRDRPLPGFRPWRKGARGHAGPGRARPPRADGPVDRVARWGMLGSADDDRRPPSALPLPARRDSG